MKFLKAFSFCVVSACLLTACHKGGEGIITVNDRPIYKSEYNKMYKEVVSSPQYSFMKDQLKDKNSAFSLMTKERIVGELILKNIVEAEIEKRNITVSDKEIEEFRKTLVERVGGEDKLKEMMAHNGISKKTFEEEIVKDIQMNKLVESIDKTKVTDADVKNFYNKNKKQFDKVNKLIQKHKLNNISNYGFCTCLDVVYSASDVVISRAGGMGLTEQLNKHIPFILREKLIINEKINKIF